MLKLGMNTDIVGSIYGFNAEREYMSDHLCLVTGSAFQGLLCWWFYKGNNAKLLLNVALLQLDTVEGQIDAPSNTKIFPKAPRVTDWSQNRPNRWWMLVVCFSDGLKFCASAG